MITSVTLENFQSHRKTTLEMGKLTMLTGGSNSGKSAALRGLIGALCNDAAGNYVTYDAKSLCVTIRTDEGYEVEWHKGSGENKYIIRRPDGTEDAPYDKVGRSVVPEAVMEILGMTPLTMEDGKTKLAANIHEQLEAPFLVSNTPGHVAKVFGELTSASKIFSAVSEGNRRNREANAKRKLRSSDLVEVEEQLAEYNELDQQLRLLEDARVLTLKANDMQAEAESLASTVSALTAATHEHMELSARHIVMQGIASTDIEELTTVSVQLENLTGYVTQYKEAEAKRTKLRRVSKPLSIAADVSGLDRALEIEQQLEILRAWRSGWDLLKTEMAETADKVGKLATAGTLIDKELDKAYRELENCPACGQELSSEDAKAHLLGEVLV